MKLYLFAFLSALFLGGCAAETPPEAPPSQAAKAAPPPDAPVMGQEVRILALGDSLFAGYGLKREESYPARLEAALRARGINARMTNAGVSGDTTAGGLQRLDFTLKSLPQPPQLTVISLGGNDMLRGLPPEQTRTNLDTIIARLRSAGSAVVVMGMLSPPNMGPDYQAKFNPIYPALAKKHDAGLVPFFLAAVIDKPDLIQADRVHPTARGIEEMVAATVGEVAKAAE